MNDTGNSFLTIIDLGVRAMVFEKFREVLGVDSFKDDSARWPKGVALRKLAERRGRTSLEFISVWRESCAPAWNRQRTSVARYGMFPKYVGSEEKAALVQGKAIPVDLTYSFWIWTKGLDKLYRITEDYLFWQHRHPNLDLEIDEEYPISLQLGFGPVADESPIEELYDKGLYFVHKFPLKVEAWLVEGLSLKTIHTLVLKVYQDVDPGGIEEKEVLLFSEEVDLTEEV